MKANSTSTDVAAESDDTTDVVTDQSKVEADAKEAEKKPQIVTSELKKLQFYGAGPKTALPDTINSGNCSLSGFFCRLNFLFHYCKG